jgi:hypothetical protein
MSSKDIYGILSLILSVIAYLPYLYSIQQRKVRPHMFTWGVWFITNGIGFFAQITRGAGPGSWSTGLTMFFCACVFILSFSRGEKNITRSDWIALVLSLVAIVIWLITKEPLGSVIMAIIVNTLGTFPTLRKSWLRPREERVLTWSILSLRAIISLFALEAYSPVTVLFPVAVILTSGGIAVTLAIRRFLLDRKTANV